MKGFLGRVMYYANWKDENTYKHTKDHNLKMWAWEFVRRNPDYWEYWKETKELYEKEIERRKNYKPIAQGIAGLGSALGLGAIGQALYDPEANRDFLIDEKDPPPSHSEFSITRFSANEKWGVIWLYPPENNKPLMFHYGDRLRVYEKNNDVKNAFLTENEVLVKFNLTKKLDPQIKLLEKQLSKLQKEKEISPAGVKNKSKNWMLYLRVLDANNSGKRRKETAPIIFPNLGENAEKSFSDALQRAKEIMNGEYRKWL